MHRILIVDDEQSIRDALARWFSLRGFDVTTARDGQEALSLCSDYAFYIIPMDLEMPRMSGNEAIARIREGNERTPVAISRSQGSNVTLLAEREGCEPSNQVHPG